jgi:polysaccharide export outer membrane protein
MDQLNGQTQQTNQMTTGSIAGDLLATSSGNRRSLGRMPVLLASAALSFGLLIAVTGCQTPESTTSVEQPRVRPEASKQQEVLTVREGDILRISFPGAQNLDTTQQVRRDGRITLSMVGEVMAAGLTPGDLEKELLKLYSSQLLSKEVTVTVVSSSIPVFVTGAVIRPGKIVSDHPISALEAIMEAGGFDRNKADMKAVVVIRQEGGQTRRYILNLKLVLEGKQTEPFYLKPSDIVYVPEKFSWF